MTNTDLTPAESLPKGMTKAQANLLASTILKNFTLDEMKLAFHTAQSYGANIFNKEMWAIKDNKGNLQMYCSRDFLIKKAYQNKEFVSLQASAVFKKDKITISETEVKHEYNPLEDRGELMGAWAKANTRSGTPYIKYAELKVYKPANPSVYTPWFKDPQAMIIKCAEASVLRRFSEMMSVYLEWEIIDEQLPTIKRSEYKRLISEANEANVWEASEIVEHARKHYHLFENQEQEIKDFAEEPMLGIHKHST